MSLIQGIVVNLKTSDDDRAATDDNIYIGVIGIGGREFPLGTGGFDDYEKGSDVTYAFGVVWDGVAISDPQVKNPRFSTNNDVNDPSHANLELTEISQVYIRKAGTVKSDHDNEYEFDSLRVTLYGRSDESRTFEAVARGRTILSNLTGLQIWLREIDPA